MILKKKKYSDDRNSPGSFFNQQWPEKSKPVSNKIRISYIKKTKKKIIKHKKSKFVQNKKQHKKRSFIHLINLFFRNSSIHILYVSETLSHRRANYSGS